MMTLSRQNRCPWCSNDSLYQRYHDTEWGVPVRDDRRLFEFLVLEGAQAGLSWITVLRKREAYRDRYADFNPAQVASFSDAQLGSLLQDDRIIRNRLKVFSARQNAQAFLEVQARCESFAQYIWAFVDGQPIQNHWRSLAEVPAVTPLAEQISRDLRRRGFNFVGPRIIYAYMQATGMVNDHLVTCFRHTECAILAAH
jgi:DNA-3-methyladenine glycosylase I